MINLPKFFDFPYCALIKLSSVWTSEILRLAIESLKLSVLLFVCSLHTSSIFSNVPELPVLLFRERVRKFRKFSETRVNWLDVFENSLGTRKSGVLMWDRRHVQISSVIPPWCSPWFPPWFSPWFSSVILSVFLSVIPSWFSPWFSPWFYPWFSPWFPPWFFWWFTPWFL